MINIGDIYWIKQDENISHPQVVIQINSENITVCGITSNMNKASMPGNVTLEIGEGDLDKKSIVEVSKITIIDISHLDTYIGALSEERFKQILTGISFVKNLLPEDRITA